MVNRLQQQIDILRCPNCYHERPVSRKQNFCFHCGLGLPILSSPKHGSCALENIGVCPYCKAHVPLNLTSCLVCEAPLQRSQVQKYGQYPEECRLCTTCGTMNPIDARSCIICEVRLPMGATNVVLSKGQSFCDSHVPCLKEQQNKYTVMNKSVRFSLCVYCHRENNPDARYCDWCGIEVPKQSLNPLNSELKSSDNNGAHHDWSFYDNHNKTSVRYGFIHCIKCDLPNPKEANYCSYCGLNLLPPPRTGWYSTSHTSNYNEFESDGNQSEKSLSQYKPLQTVVANVSTQTVGLFYPSSTDLRRQARLTQSRLSADAQLRDKAPVLTAVSPGRGFWRKQLDHIFAHLKLYTNNNSEFRAAIGQPRFGKLLSADLCEASNQAKITLTYTLPSDKKTVTSGTGNQIISNKVSVDSDYNDGKLSHSMKYPNQSKQNLDSFKNLNRQENTYEQQLTARQSPAPCPVKDDQYEMMRSSPVQRGNTDINHIPPKSSHEYYENKSKTGSSEAEEDESKNVTKSTKSLNSTKKKPDHKYSGLRPNPHTQYGETGVALLRNSKLSTSDINLLYTLSQTNVDIHEVKRLLKEMVKSHPYYW
uniref:DZANK-type domain-containing protein n=1 Tax=Trichobilharzia regenti TaxID=157069 RepID=A0AA85JQC3_TRIRE|nr:unnamed protein product [Trichobilharzia regenti]